MSITRALIVDDEPDIRELLEITLSRMGVDTASAADLAEARKLLKMQAFDLCLTDMRLPDGDGIDLVRHIVRRSPDMPVAVITAHGNMDTAITALKAGAFDFVSKPVDLGMLRKLVSTALKLLPDTEAKTGESGSTRFIGNSPVAHKIIRMTRKLSRSQAPVHISGESGTGKELAARMIHEQSPRSSKAFVAVNCGAIPPELMESEFFGYLKGSFTGAHGDREGLFQAADGGTLFLDEIADLPLNMQVKLLRVIQEKSVRPLGAASEIPIDVRIVSATHKDLAALVRSGEFRQDLFYRIHVIQLDIPPLRERREDIPELAHALVARQGNPDIDLTASALEALSAYSFPGNIRELENILERAQALCDNGRIDTDDLGLPPTSPDTQKSPRKTLSDQIVNMERKSIEEALDETHWNRTAAARKLGMTLRQLRYRMEKLGLTPAE